MFSSSFLTARPQIDPKHYLLDHFSLNFQNCPLFLLIQFNFVIFPNFLNKNVRF